MRRALEPRPDDRARRERVSRAPGQVLAEDRRAHAEATQPVDHGAVREVRAAQPCRRSARAAAVAAPVEAKRRRPCARRASFIAEQRALAVGGRGMRRCGETSATSEHEAAQMSSLPANGGSLSFGDDLREQFSS